MRNNYYTRAEAAYVLLVRETTWDSNLNLFACSDRRDTPAALGTDLNIYQRSNLHPLLVRPKLSFLPPSSLDRFVSRNSHGPAYSKTLENDHEILVAR